MCWHLLLDPSSSVFVFCQGRGKCEGRSFCPCSTNWIQTYKNPPFLTSQVLGLGVLSLPFTGIHGTTFIFVLFLPHYGYSVIWDTMLEIWNVEKERSQILFWLGSHLSFVSRNSKSSCVSSLPSLLCLPNHYFSSLNHFLLFQCTVALVSIISSWSTIILLI